MVYVFFVHRDKVQVDEVQPANWVNVKIHRGTLGNDKATKTLSQNSNVI